MKLLLALLLGSLSLLLACSSSRPSGAQGTGASSAQAGTSTGGASSSGGSPGSGAVSEPGITYIQEDELGFSGVDGNILPRQGSTSVVGYTGKGFADSDAGFGKSISWNVNAEVAGSYQNNAGGSCINSRMGAVVKAENNYFLNSKDPIGFSDSPRTGFWEVSNNTFIGCEGSQPTVSTGMLTIPYAYSLDPVSEVPTLVAQGAGVGKL